MEVVVQSLSCVWFFVTPWTLSFTISLSLLKFLSIDLMMLSNHLILLLPSPLALSLSQHQYIFLKNILDIKALYTVTAIILIVLWSPIRVTVTKYLLYTNEKYILYFIYI